jgi:hypothetical protein
MFLYASGNESVTVEEPSVIIDVQSVVPRVMEMTAVVCPATYPCQDLLNVVGRKAYIEAATPRKTWVAGGSWLAEEECTSERKLPAAPTRTNPPIARPAIQNFLIDTCK